MSQGSHQSNEQERSQPLWDDPVIEEVRAIRRRLWEESGRSIRRYIEQSEQREERRRRQGPAAADGGKATE